MLIGFTAYPLISKKYIKGYGYKRFIPLFLAFSALGALTIPFIVYRHVSFDFSYLPLLALLGGMYTLASYLVFYSIEHHNISVLNSIVGSQDVLIALFSGFLFLISEIKTVVLPALIILVGIFLLAYSNQSKDKSRISRYVIFTFVGVLIWVFMWILFYTINTSLPLLYYGILQLFAFVFCIPIALFHNKKKGISYYLKGKQTKYILIAGVLTGVATAMFSFAYKFNALLTPFVGQLGVPLVILFSVVFLMERPQKMEIIGLILLSIGPFIYILF